MHIFPQVNEVPAGCWALVEGVESSLVKTGTLTALKSADDSRIFRPLAFHTSSIVKIAAEPLHPSELPKMLEGALVRQGDEPHVRLGVDLIFELLVRRAGREAAACGIGSS